MEHRDLCSIFSTFLSPRYQINSFPHTLRHFDQTKLWRSRVPQQISLGMTFCNGFGWPKFLYHHEGQSLLDYTSSSVTVTVCSFTVRHPCPCEGHLEPGTVPGSHHSLHSPSSLLLFLTTLYSLPQTGSITQSKVTPKKPHQINYHPVCQPN